jgi:Cu+-exporting ATPase
MDVEIGRARFQTEHQKQTYYFCSEGCRNKFVADPAHYLSPTSPPPTKAAAIKWTCPMHPQIIRDAPGACPICGMALELKTVTTEAVQDNSELIDMNRRFWIGAALTVPVFFLTMLHHVPKGPPWLSGDLSRWIQFILSTPVVFWTGWPFFKRAWRSVQSCRLNMFTLIAVGVGGNVPSANAQLRPDRKTRQRRSLSCTSVADSAARSAARSRTSDAEYMYAGNVRVLARSARMAGGGHFHWP